MRSHRGLTPLFCPPYLQFRPSWEFPMPVFSFPTTSNHSGLWEFHISVFTDEAKALSDSVSLSTPCVFLDEWPPSHRLWLYLLNLLNNRFSGPTLHPLINSLEWDPWFALLTSSSDDFYIRRFHYYYLRHYIEISTNESSWVTWLQDTSWIRGKLVLNSSCFD